MDVVVALVKRCFDLINAKTGRHPDTKYWVKSAGEMMEIQRLTPTQIYEALEMALKNPAHRDKVSTKGISYLQWNYDEITRVQQAAPAKHVPLTLRMLAAGYHEKWEVETHILEARHKEQTGKPLPFDERGRFVDWYIQTHRAAASVPEKCPVCEAEIQSDERTTPERARDSWEKLQVIMGGGAHQQRRESKRGSRLASM